LWSIFIHRSTICLRKWEFKEETHKLCAYISRSAAIELLFRPCSCRRKLSSCACPPANSDVRAQTLKYDTWYVVMQAYQCFSARNKMNRVTHCLQSADSSENPAAYHDILSRAWVTTDGVWLGNWIYWTLTDRNYQ
jgi:hypothetical protein